MALRVAHFDAPEIGRGSAASPDRFSYRQLALTIVGLSVMSLHLTGNLPVDDRLTIAACAALIVFGLPHGSLDIALLRRNARLGARQTLAVVQLYLSSAAAMYAVWHYAPVIALAIFFVMSCIHFAEDWADILPPFFAVGTAMAILTAPTLLHRDALAAILVELTGASEASVLVDIGTLAAPVALTAAGVGIWSMVQDRNRPQACETAIVISAMIALPPVLGFALFFCLAHSPVQLAMAKAQFAPEIAPNNHVEIAVLTTAALGITALVFAFGEAGSLADGAIRTSFVTLSILTVPHMAVPMIVAAWHKHARAIA